MTHYVAIVEEEEGKAFGVWFPDLPGCVSAGDTLDEAMAKPAEALALYRMALSLVLFLSVGTVMVNGLDVIWTPERDGGLQSLPGSYGWVAFLGGPSLHTASATAFLTLWSAVLMFLGLGGRLTAFVCLQGFMSLSRLHNDALGSYDFLMSNGLWLLVLGPSTETLSLDAWARTLAWFDRHLA